MNRTKYLIKIFIEIKKMVVRHDLRVGQLFYVLNSILENHYGKDLYYMENKELLTYLIAFNDDELCIV